jgi:NAD(P)-dependent dehydrogenase (short-subunit alcohol dehydrogenase family)
VNLFGAYHCARLAIPHLRRRGGGKIIAIGTGLGHSSRGGTVAYSCSKAALWMLVRILADELRGDNIAVNELIPGLVRTDISTSGVPTACRKSGSSGTIARGKPAMVDSETTQKTPARLDCRISARIADIVPSGAVMPVHLGAIKYDREAGRAR